MNASKLLGPAASFVAYALPRLTDRERGGLRHVILFGSVAQGRATEASDIDLFFDVTLPKTAALRLRRRLGALEEQFRLSTEALRAKAAGMGNPISCVVGDLNAWEEMKASVGAGGIVLYGRYIPRFTSKGFSRQFLCVWRAEGRNRGAFLNALFGYRVGSRRYSGMLERRGGERIGRGAALLSETAYPAVSQLFERYAIPYTVREVFVPGEGLQMKGA